jgi:lysophospholipase L1-like esterase
MIWPEPTRLARTLALASAAAHFGCQGREVERPDPPRAARPFSASASASATATATSPRPVPHDTPADVLPVASTSPAPERPITSLLVLGDSLSDEAVGGGGYVRLLRERCRGALVDNHAKGGFMVNQVRKRFETAVVGRGQRYSHAVVFGGVNDLYSDKTANRTLTRIQTDLSAIYGRLKAAGVHVTAITVTPWGGFKKWFTPERSRNTLALNAWIVEQARSGVIDSVVDAYPLLSCGDAEQLCPELAAPHKDGLHFGKLGHQKLGQALLDSVFSGCAR